MSYRAGKSRIVFFVAALAVAAALFVGWLNGGAYTETFPRPFNAERWKAADTGTATRCGMILDLQYRVGVVGKTRAELAQLLGEPGKGSGSASYWVLCPSFMDMWVLEVRWQDGRAVAASVRDT